MDFSNRKSSTEGRTVPKPSRLCSESAASIVLAGASEGNLSHRIRQAKCTTDKYRTECALLLEKCIRSVYEGTEGAMRTILALPASALQGAN